MKKIIIGNIEFEVNDDIYEEVENDFIESEFLEFIGLDEDGMSFPDWLSTKYTNTILKALLNSLKVHGEEYISRTVPELADRLQALYSDTLAIDTYALKLYEEAKMDIEANITLIRLINSLCYIDTMLIGQTRG